jgi:hypothetical protein
MRHFAVLYFDNSVRIFLAPSATDAIVAGNSYDSRIKGVSFYDSYRSV